jgi:hypothetical protein
LGGLSPMPLCAVTSWSPVPLDHYAAAVGQLCPANHLLALRARDPCATAVSAHPHTTAAARRTL